MTKRIKEALDVDMARLRTMLGRTVGADAGELGRSLRKKGEARILDIACGACNEADTLTNFLAELHGGEGLKVKLTGIDVRAREIDDARRRFRNRSRHDTETGVEKEFEFLTGDATRLDGHAEMGEDFDLVVLRHQNYWNGVQTWEEIFDRALEKLSVTGRLVITSYFDREHRLALDAIQRLGGKLISTATNPQSRELGTEGKSVDRRIAVFRKNETT